MATMSINVCGQLMDLSTPRVMGILNATPDSFFASSRHQTAAAVVRRVSQMLLEGADIIDVGACSTRPGSVPVDEDEERNRLRTALSALRREAPDAVVSVDTFRPDVARMAVEEFGVAIVNDIGDPNEQAPADGCPAMFRMVSRLRVPYILMSTQADMHAMLMRFARDVQQLRALGHTDIILDPGFGFGKTLRQNYDVLRHLDMLRVMHLPILVGVSRKRMVWQLLGTSPDEALNGTTALHVLALQQGASILRVHDVKEAVETVKVFREYDGAGGF